MNRHRKTEASEVSLKDSLELLANKKYTVMFSTVIFFSFFLIIGNLLPDEYQSEALLAPKVPPSFSSNVAKNYGSIASLSGINIPNTGDESKIAKALKKVNSLSFFESNIAPNIFLPNLMAFDSWDSATNTVRYKKSIYSLDEDRWLKESNESLPPTSQESFKAFRKNLLIVEDSKSGFITLKIKHQSPHIAKKWTKLVIDEINLFYREKNKREALMASKYLNEQISKTSLSEIKQVIANLLQEETKKLTLIEVNEFYVFEYIDPPVVMEERISPNRLLISLLGAFIGFFISIFYLLFRKYILILDSL